MKIPSFSDLSIGVLAICSIIVTVIIVRHELNSLSTFNKVKTVSDWNFLLKGGHHDGPADAPVKLIEFSDFQCPYCERMEPVLKHIFKKYPDKIEFVYYNFPLAIHPQATPAAKAAECAARQGDFFAYHDILYQNQPSFSHQPWDSLAVLAGIKDTSSFSHCLEDTSVNGLIQKDEKIGQQIGVTGTPTFVINGKMIVGARSDDRFDQLIREAMNK